MHVYTQAYQQLQDLKDLVRLSRWHDGSGQLCIYRPIDISGVKELGSVKHGLQCRMRNSTDEHEHCLQNQTHCRHCPWHNGDVFPRTDHWPLLVVNVVVLAQSPTGICTSFVGGEIN